MNVSLTHERRTRGATRWNWGAYLSASEVMREALRLLEERDKLQEVRREELRKEIRKGLDSGPAEPLDMEAVKAEGAQEVFAAGQTRVVFL